jgi:3-hydroxyisobutyrate dehydrogenase-like beta-hydroxyacid dehydrogenase
MTDSATSAGLLGLGALGEIFCGHLRAAFPALRVFDLDAGKVARSGATATASARELGAACEVVVVTDAVFFAAEQARRTSVDSILSAICVA